MSERVSPTADVIKQIRKWLSEGFTPEEVAVLHRSVKGAKALAAAMGEAGIRAGYFDGDDDLPPGTVTTMTMHRAKGSEFRCVAIAGIGHRGGLWVDPTSIAEPRERALLYVAMSRPRERLALFAAEEAMNDLRHLIGAERGH
jgi:superfamily I DNA and RNA helicase